MKSRVIPALLFFLAAAAQISLRESFSLDKAPRFEKFVFSLPDMSPLFGGYRELAADLFWITAIQKFGYCGQGEQTVSPNLGKDIPSILTHQMGNSACHLGWTYQMINQVTNLAPRLRLVYYHGAIGLSVISDDREGAKIVFEKGLRQFPNYWQLAYAASYHYLYEVRDGPRAADLLIQASQFGGPSWLPVLASRIYSEGGNLEIAESVLGDVIRTTKDREVAERAAQKLDEIRKNRSGKKDK